MPLHRLDGENRPLTVVIIPAEEHNHYHNRQYLGGRRQSSAVQYWVLNRLAQGNELREASKDGRSAGKESAFKELKVMSPSSGPAR
jgi:hypothetical protein